MAPGRRERRELSLETMEARRGCADVNARITDVTSLTGRIARTKR